MTTIQSHQNPAAILSEFASESDYERLPPNVAELSKKVLLDTIGVMVAATTLEKAVLPIIQLVKDGGGNEESTVIGFGGKVPCWNAAFANGALSHALDYSSSDSRGVAPGGGHRACGAGDGRANPAHERQAADHGDCDRE